MYRNSWRLKQIWVKDKHYGHESADERHHILDMMDKCCFRISWCWFKLEKIQYSLKLFTMNNVEIHTALKSIRPSKLMQLKRHLFMGARVGPAVKLCKHSSPIIFRIEFNSKSACSASHSSSFHSSSASSWRNFRGPTCWSSSSTSWTLMIRVA